MLKEVVSQNLEGLMIKTLHSNALYEPGKRSLLWLKLKKDYINTGNLSDSFDLVPIGAIRGQGRRQGQYGSFLMAIYDATTD